MSDHFMRHATSPRLTTDYIASENPEAAARVGDSIVKAAQSLCRFPLPGKVLKKGGPRELVLDRYPYNILYRVSPK